MHVHMKVAFRVVPGLKPGRDGHYRFPRLKPLQPNVEKELAAREARVIVLLIPKREKRVEMGREFIGIKDIVKETYGKRQWQLYFARTFTGPHGITLRTAQNYMNLARDEDDKKNESVSFNPATHEVAQASKANTRATEDEAKDLPRIFKVPLLVTPEQEAAYRKLIKSKDWPSEQLKFLALLDHICGLATPKVIDVPSSPTRPDERGSEPVVKELPAAPVEHEPIIA